MVSAWVEWGGAIDGRRRLGGDGVAIIDVAIIGGRRRLGRDGLAVIGGRIIGGRIITDP